MTTIDEASARRPGFVAGALVRLSDGSSWSLPLRDPAKADPEYDGLLGMVAGCADQAETLRAELALTIFLLTRNYDLSAGALDRLLRFAPGDPALIVLQRDVHAIALESLRRSSSAAGTSPTAPHATPTTRARRFETT